MSPLRIGRRQALQALAGFAAAAAGCTRREAFGSGDDPLRPDRLRLVHSIGAGSFRLHLDDAGLIVAEVAGEHYGLRSAFSYPGTRLGANAIGESPDRSESAWRVSARRDGARTLVVSAAGRFYRLVRTLTADDSRIIMVDELSSLADADVGVLVSHRLACPRRPHRVLIGGAPVDEERRARDRVKTLAKRLLRSAGLRAPARFGYLAENPTLFVSLDRSQLGVVAEDTLSRLQLEAGEDAYGAWLALAHIALRPGARHTLRWSLYPAPGGEGYFGFVNRVRRAWNVNFTVDGPWSFLDLGRHHDTLRDTARLRTWLDAHPMKIAAFVPWLDYDDADSRTGRRLTRAEYREAAREGRARLRASAPGLRCTGSLSANMISPPADLARALYEALPADRRRPGVHRCTDEQMRLLRTAAQPWRDCLITGADGRHVYEFYESGARRVPSIALAGYAAPGNWLAAFWLDQSRFLLEDVGLDGVYVDQFNLAFASTPSQRFTYDRWDGVTVDIDPGTGNITRRYTDAGLAGAAPQAALMAHVRARHGTFVANTYAATDEAQAHHVARFVEGQELFNALEVIPGRMPPLTRSLSRGHLQSPVALGYQESWAHSPTPAEVSARMAITFLRHSLLYYNFDVETDGFGRPASLMFPLTPVRLGEGFVEGAEAIVTAVSGTFRWEGAAPPRAWRFDATGAEHPADIAVRRSSGSSYVDVRLADWAELAIVR